MKRRDFLKAAVMGVTASIVPASAWASAAGMLCPKRSLSFYNLHTDESLSVDYFVYGRHSPKALRAINHILRDHRSDEIRSIDINLLDVLYAISKRLDTQQPFHVISGYRSPATNAMLNKKSRNVAKKSLHMSGQAIDISLPQVCLSKLRRTAMDLRAGGVGYYPNARFVHVDIGPIRYW